MKVIIPVAGTGTRLRPHTYSLPKPLLTVADKTILAHILDPVISLKPDEVIFVIGYKGDLIRKYVSENYSFIATFVEQDKLLGLGYAINLAMKSIKDEPLLIILGDTIVKCDLKKFISTGENVIGLKEVDDPSRFGIAEPSEKKIIQLVEKPENG